MYCEANTTEELSFYKGKMLGRITYKKTNTTVQIFPEHIKVVQETKKIFCRTKSAEQIIPLTQIRSAQSKIVFDFWDTLYAIISAILGILLNPVILLLTVVCLFCAFGKVIRLDLVDGRSIHIPFSHENESANRLLSICK